jgi:ubiquinone/menaquinone biosynthesis C-methylase UbiE
MTTPQKTRKQSSNFYNQVAHKFSQTRKHFWYDLEFIKEEYDKDGKLLDFGCGNGRLIDFLQIPPDKYVGVDNSEELIKIAKQKYPKHKFILIKDEGKLPFKNKEFDQVFSIAVFHHFTPQMAEKTLRELRRITKKDGKIILTIWRLWKKKYIKYLIKNCLKRNFSLLINLPFKINSGKEVFWRPCYFWTKNPFNKIIKKTNLQIKRVGISTNHKKEKRNYFWILRK